MLNVRPKLQRVFDDMKAVSAMAPEERRTYRKKQQEPVSQRASSGSPDVVTAPVVSEQDAAVLRVHPTVLISSSASITDAVRPLVQQTHDDLQQSSRHAVLETRRSAAQKELRGLLEHVFVHCRESAESATILREKRAALPNGARPKRVAQPTVAVPSLQDIMTALAEEKMHFEEKLQTTNPAEFHQSLARQMQWLLDELGHSKERAELYEHQYKLLLLAFGQQAERLDAANARVTNLENDLAEQVKALSSEKAHAAESAQQAELQLEAARGRVKELLEANFQLMQGGNGITNLRPGGAGANLPPLRTARRQQNAAALASLMGTASGGGTTSPRGKHLTVGGGSTDGGSRSTTPRPTAMDSLTSPRLTAAAAPSVPSVPASPPPTPLLSLDEKEKYLMLISNLRREAEGLRQQVANAEEDTKAAQKLIEVERGRVELAERAGQLEVAAQRNLLQSLRDGHLKQLSQLEAQLAQSQAKCSSQERTTEALQERLKESTARLLSLQNLLLSGPSLQTLMVSQATNRYEADQALESLGELADRIAVFADEFSQLSAADLTEVKRHIAQYVHDREAGLLPEPSASASASSAAAAGGAAANGSLGAEMAGNAQAAPRSPSTASVSTAGVVAASHMSSPLSPLGVGGGGAAAAAAAASKRRKPTFADAAAQTDDVLIGGANSSHAGSAGDEAGSRPASKQQAGRPAASPRAGAAGLKPKPSGTSKNPVERRGSDLETIAGQIAVSVPGGNDSTLGQELDLPPEDDAKSTTEISVARESSSGSASPTGLGMTDSKQRAPLQKSGSSTSLKSTASRKGSNLKPSGAAKKTPGGGGKRGSVVEITETTSTVFGDENEMDSDEEIAAEEAALKARQQSEHELARRIQSQVKSGGISSTGLNLSQEATNEINANLERMTALRKQLSASAEQVYQLQLQVEKERKAVREGEERLEEQVKQQAQSAAKIQALTRQFDAERIRAEKMSERVSVTLHEIAEYQEKLHEAVESKDAVEESLNTKIQELEKTIEKFKRADQRSAMLNKERQFMEVCERLIRCLMSAEATSSCPLCLSQLVNPVTIAPCGHCFCERCFLLHQSEKDVSLPTETFDALQTIFNFRSALAAFHEEEEQAQADFLAGRVPLPPEARRPPKPPTGYLTRTPFVKSLVGCPFLCPECDKPAGLGYLQQARLEELCSKLSYIESVVGELQEMSKRRYAEELLASDPNAEIQLEKMVMGDKSKKTQKKTYVDLEATPSTSSDDER